MPTSTSAPASVSSPWRSPQRVPPVPYVPAPAGPLDAVPFAEALLRAERALEGVPVEAGEICETDQWWLFPCRQIGCYGAIVDKRSGRATDLGSGLGWPVEAVIWAFEQGLIEEPARTIRVDAVHDLSTATAALAGFARLGEGEVTAALACLPATFRGNEPPFQVASLWRARDAMDFVVLPQDP